MKIVIFILEKKITLKRNEFIKLYKKLWIWYVFLTGIKMKYY